MQEKKQKKGLTIGGYFYYNLDHLYTYASDSNIITLVFNLHYVEEISIKVKEKEENNQSLFYYEGRPIEVPINEFHRIKREVEEYLGI